MDSGPAGAAWLRDQGVDIALFTPVSTATRTVSTLAHVFEAAGIATIALGSVRKQIESTAPPRGLWCDFPLGRPLGKPGDPEFQHRVLAAAFALLDATEPVLAEFDEAITDDGTEMLACPLPPRHDPDAHPAVDEARGFAPRATTAASR